MKQSRRLSLRNRFSPGSPRLSSSLAMTNESIHNRTEGEARHPSNRQSKIGSVKNHFIEDGEAVAVIGFENGFVLEGAVSVFQIEFSRLKGLPWIFP